MEQEEHILKVGTGTDVLKVKDAIIACAERHPKDMVILRSIGAGALNQAIKAAVASNEYFSKKGLSVALVPSFRNLDDEDGVTAIELRIILRRN